MRFKQTKPQHVKNKSESAEGCGYINKSLQETTKATDVDWEDYDCVDGDLNTSQFTPQKQAIDIVKQLSGHAPVMDVIPMLELYNTDECNGKEGLMDNHQEDSQPLTVTENDVIIQGRRPIFSEAEESNIASQLSHWKEQGMKYTRLDVVKMASEYAVHLGKRPQGRPLTVKWFRSFLTRHPECYIRKSRRTKNERPEKQFFNQLDLILTTYNMKESPHCIFSLVEMPLPVLQPGNDALVPEDLSLHSDAINGSKAVKGITLLNKVPSSVVFCGSAAGQALPPFLLFAGNVLDKSFLSGLTPGANGVASPSSRATAEVLISFLREHFLSHAPGRAGDTLILLLDANFGRCLSQAVIDLGSAFKVVFVTAQTTLHPHLHPMAAGCCNTFQRELCYELQKPAYSSESTLTSPSSLCEFVCRLYHRHMTAENLHSTFRKAGIFPFNPSICRKRYGLATVDPDLSLIKNPNVVSHNHTALVKNTAINNEEDDNVDKESIHMDDDGDLQ